MCLLLDNCDLLQCFFSITFDAVIYQINTNDIQLIFFIERLYVHVFIKEKVNKEIFTSYCCSNSLLMKRYREIKRYNRALKMNFYTDDLS
jgi:predicted nucleic acid-binding protein